MSKDEIRDTLVDSLKLDRARKLTVELMLDARESDIRHLESELERVEKQRDELLQVLKFYADRESWATNLEPGYNWKTGEFDEYSQDVRKLPVMGDMGARARNIIDTIEQALASVEGEE